MKITNAQLTASVPAIQVLVESRLPVKASFAISRLTRQINVAIADFAKTKDEIIENHTLKEDGVVVADANGARQVSDPDGFTADYQALLDIEIELDVEKISVDDLGNAQIEPNNVLLLDWLITA